jgi:methionyl-tRNA formyltransferase
MVTGQPRRLRIAFFGTPAFAVPTLAVLLDSPHEVVAVVTQPDRPRGRGQRVSYAPVKALAAERQVSVLQPERLSRELFHDVFVSHAADLGVVAAYGKILPEWLLQAPPLGMINVHASLLPKYRGAAPVHRAVIAGETETGVTIMRVVKALDAGPMLARAVRPIALDDTSDAVEQDLAILGARLLVDTLGPLAAGTQVEVAQDDSQSTYAPRLTKEEGLLDFTRPAMEVHNRIRGLRPWPGGYTFLSQARIVFHRARLSDQPPTLADPGSWTSRDLTSIAVACGDGRAIDVFELQPEGRRAMTAREFLAGHARGAVQRFG